MMEPTSSDPVDPHSLRSQADAYDSLYRKSPFEDRPALYEWVVGLAGVRVGDAVLDIGCGIGGGLVATANAGGAPFGVDLSQEALHRARARVRTAHLCQGDGARLPFPSKQFRTVLNLGNLEHFLNLAGGITEMRRVLTDDGRAWILLPNLFYSGAVWRVIRTGYGPDHHQPIDRFATRREWKELLESHGLEVVRSWPYHKGKWWKRLLPSNLAWHFLYETRRAHPLETPALPPLERIRPPRTTRD